MEVALDSVLNQFHLGGLNLRERLALLGTASTRTTNRSPRNAEVDTLLLEWKTRLEEHQLWQERLASLGIEEADFFLLASPPHLPPMQVVPLSTRNALQEVFSPTIKGDFSARRRQYGEGLPPLPPALQRFVENQFSNAIRSQTSPIDPSQCQDLDGLVENEINYTLTDLFYSLLPVLTTELHVAAARGSLEGNAPELRFKSFCDERIASTDWLMEFLATYPVVVRLLDTVVSARVRNFVELLSRFDADRRLLEERGFLQVGSILQSISSGTGDPHREGRTVRILQITGGGRVVYKPRPVSVDVAFQDAVRWLNKKSFTPELSILPILERDRYGWFSYVESADCRDVSAVGRFYRRQGAHLALLYLLGGHDFLAENVRAYGEFPVLIDLECFLGSWLPGFVGQFYDSAARRCVAESVAWTGLLPEWSWTHYGKEGVDLSALTAAGAQLTPQEIPSWVDRGSETLRQERRRMELPLEKPNLPTLEGVPQPVNDFISAFRDGFCDAYTILEKNKADFSTQRMISSFANVECRVLLRNTQDYRTLLDALRHPRYLRDALRRSEFLDRLWFGRCPRYLPSVIDAETEQLWRGDIPLFTTQGSSRNLFNDRGQLVARDYLQESGIDGVKRRLARLGSADLARQLEIMDGAFGSVQIPRPGAGEIVMSPNSGEQASSTPQLTLQSLTDDAVWVGDQLLASAIEDETSLNWIGMVMNESQQYAHGALDASLYDGFTGIGLFFLYLDALRHESRFEGAWRKILDYGGVRPARFVLENRSRLDAWVHYQPGGFTFPFGALYVAIQAARFGEADGLDAMLDASLAFGSIGLKRKPRFDFVTGAAGLIRSLLVAYRFMGSSKALNLARAYGDLMIAHAIPTDTGVGWPSEASHLPPLMGGFAHGVSGIAWVLADLAHETGDESYLHFSLKALAYDRTLFNAREEQWKDLRKPSQPGTAVQWCHGPPGIGLSRVLLARYVTDSLLADDVAHAVEITLTGMAQNDCLCHGTLGNLDFCTTAAEEFRNTSWSRATRENASSVCQDAHGRGYWRSGVPGHDVGLHGLFMGMAGIGYGLLRLASPDAVPSVLYLEDPKSCRDS